MNLVMLNQYLAEKINELASQQASKRKPFTVLDIHNFSVEDYYYILKFYNLYNKDNMKKINKMGKNYFKKEYSSDRLKELDESYNDKMLILPKQIYFYPIYHLDLRPVLLSLDELNINEETESIFFSNFSQVYTICRLLKNNESIKNVIVTKDLEKFYSDYFFNQIPQNLILVDKDIELSDLNNLDNNKLVLK